MTDAPHPSAAAASGGRRSHGAILLALAVVFLITGCGNTAITPSAAATPTATPTVLASASVGPKATPKADPGATAVSAFVALVTKGGFSYQATFTGQSRHSVDILPIRNGLLQVSGDDVLVRATWTLQGKRSAVEHRYVGGKAWIRFDPTDAWHRLTFRPSDSMGAFAAIRTKADVSYLGPVVSGGKTSYKVSFRSTMVNPVMIPAGNLTETVITSPKMTLLIDASGRPLSATAVIVGHGRVSGQLQEIVIELTVTFVKVGQAISIKAP